MGLTTLLIAPLLMAAAGAPVPAKFTLPNGLQVELYEEHGHPFARAQMVYRAGGKDDPIGRAGLAHLVEHLMFQGTRHLRSGDVHRLFTAAGADQVRGYTTEDETGYFVRLPAASVELACWVFSSQMGFFLDQPDAARVLERERQVVLEELAGSEDAPETGLRARVAMRLLHGPGHPYARLTGGNRAELARVTPEDVRRFFLRHYRPDNATLTLGAPLPAAQLRALVEKYFGPLPRRAAPPAAAVPVVPAGVRRATIEAPVSLPALSMVWSAPPGRDLWALAAILDRRLTSKLGALPHPTYEPRALGGLLQLEMQLDSRIARVPPGKVEPAIDEVLAKLAREPVTAEELNHARTMTG